jgi:hypothetical protein
LFDNDADDDDDTQRPAKIYLPQQQRQQQI